MKKWINILATIIVLGLLIFILRDINFYEVYVLLAEANTFWLILAILATGGTFVASTFNLKQIFKKILKFDFFYFMKVILTGAFFNTVTPSAGIGGEPFKAHYLAEKYKKPKSELLGGVLAEGFFRMVIFFTFVLLSILFVFMFVRISNNLKLILEGVLLFIFASSFIVLLTIFKKSHSNWKLFFKKLYWFRFVKKRFETEEAFMNYARVKAGTFYYSFKKVIMNKRTFVIGLLYGLGFWFCNFLTAYFLFLAFGYNFNFFLVIIVFSLAQVIGSLAPVPGGIGVVEGSRMLLYTAMGVPFSVALLVAFLQRIIYYFFSLFLGGMSLVHLKMFAD